MPACDLRCDKDEPEHPIWDNCSTCPGRDNDKPFPGEFNGMVEYQECAIDLGRLKSSPWRPLCCKKNIDYHDSHAVFASWYVFIYGGDATWIRYRVYMQ